MTEVVYALPDPYVSWGPTPTITGCTELQRKEFRRVGRVFL